MVFYLFFSFIKHNIKEEIIRNCSLEDKLDCLFLSLTILIRVISIAVESLENILNQLHFRKFFGSFQIEFQRNLDLIKIHKQIYQTTFLFLDMVELESINVT